MPFSGLHARGTLRCVKEWAGLVALCALALAAFSAATVGAATKQATTYHDHDPVFSPGGLAIAFVRRASTGTSQVYVMRRDGRDVHAVTPAQPVQSGVTWAPDGTSLAYTSNGDIWRVDLATKTPLNLTHDPTHESWQPDWSPDGAWIVYDRFEQCYRCTVVHFVSADGTQTRDNFPSGNMLARRPTYSPNGEEIALSFSTDTVVALDGTVIAKSNGADYASWSPDGTSLIYTGAGLNTFDVRAQRSRLLTTKVKAYPVWSRDGSRIAGTGFRGALAIVDRNGKPVATIRSADTLNDGPTWGADGRVAYVHAGQCGIDVAHGDGTHVHRLTKTC